MTTDTSIYQEKIDRFRASSEDNYIFACQAAVPLVITPDLLYQLWNNFKLYEYIFEAGHVQRIPHFAVSDLLLSGLCREVGHEIFEIEKGVRDILITDLICTLGHRRRNTIAQFLNDYALLEYRHANRKNLKDIHLLTARSILQPAAMEQEIINRINQSADDREKMNLLLLHHHLMAGSNSDLAQISEGSLSLKPILIREENKEAPGIMHVNLPAGLQGRIQQQAPPPAAEVHPAMKVLQRCYEEQEITLNLTFCGLTDEDLEERTEISILLKQCKHIETLIIKDQAAGRVHNTEVPGQPNQLTKLPAYLPLFKNLSMLSVGGNGQSISDIDIINQLPSLVSVDAGHNAIQHVTIYNELPYLKYLSLNNNTLKSIHISVPLPSLENLDLRFNELTDFSGIMSILTRTSRPLIITEWVPRNLNEAIVLIAQNPITLLLKDYMERGNEAVLEFLKREYAHPITAPVTNNEKEQNQWVAIQLQRTSDKAGNVIVGFRIQDAAAESVPFFEARLKQSDFNEDFRAKFREFYDQYNNAQLPNIIWIIDQWTQKLPLNSIETLTRQPNSFPLFTGVVAQTAAYSTCNNLSLGNKVFIAEHNRSQDLIADAFTTGSGLKYSPTILHGSTGIAEQIRSGDYKILHITADTVNIEKTILVVETATNKPSVIFLQCTEPLVNNEVIRLLEAGIPGFITYHNTAPSAGETVDRFASVFYRLLLDGFPFGEAVFKAKRAAHLYVGEEAVLSHIYAYGDPHFILPHEAQAPASKKVRINNAKKLSPFAHLVVKVKTDREIASGLLVKGWQLKEELGDTIYLLTTSYISGQSDELAIIFDKPKLREKFSRLKAAEVLWTSETLGATLMRIDPRRQKELQEYLQEQEYYDIAVDVPANGAATVYIMGYPNTGALQTNYSYEGFSGFNGQIFRHHLHSSAGSAGSPIFDEQLRLAGIHIGTARTTSAGKTNDPKEAAWIGAIIEDIRISMRTGDDPGLLKSLSAKYEATRATMPSGPERTTVMTSIVSEMREIAGQYLHQLAELTQSEVPGERLAAIALLQEVPNPVYLEWLCNRVGDAEKPFVGFHATVAIYAIAKSFEHIPFRIMNNAVSKALENVKAAAYADQNQVNMLEGADKIIQSKKTDSLGDYLPVIPWTTLLRLVLKLNYDAEAILHLTEELNMDIAKDIVMKSPTHIWVQVIYGAEDRRKLKNLIRLLSQKHPGVKGFQELLDSYKS